MALAQLVEESLRETIYLVVGKVRGHLNKGRGSPEGLTRSREPFPH